MIFFKRVKQAYKSFLNPENRGKNLTDEMRAMALEARIKNAAIRQETKELVLENQKTDLMADLAEKYKFLKEVSGDGKGGTEEMILATILQMFLNNKNKENPIQTKNLSDSASAPIVPAEVVPKTIAQSFVDSIPKNALPLLKKLPDKNLFNSAKTYSKNNNLEISDEEINEAIAIIKAQ